MAQTEGTGVTTFVGYGFESTFGTAVAAVRPFGHGQSVSFSNKNNMEKVFGLGARNASTSVAKKFEGNASVDFILSHGTFFRAVLGAVTDGGATPYTHTYAEANTIPSFTTIIGSELGTNDANYTLSGCKIKSCGITAAVGELAKVRLDCPYKSISIATTLSTTATQPSEEPFSFAQGTLTVAGSDVADVQNFDMTITNDVESVFGLGARTLSSMPEKKREYELKLSLIVKDPALFSAVMLGDASAPYIPSTGTPSSVALVLTFTNGLATTNTRSIVMTFAGIYFDSDDLKFDPNELVKEDLSGHALSCTSIVWSNNTSADNASP